jgi:hypothetical protein
MRERLEDPEFKQAYLAKLSATKRRSDWTDYAALTRAALQWRKDNPRKAYKIGYRNVRIATKHQNRRFTAKDDKTGSYGRLWINNEKVLSARRSYFGKKSQKAFFNSMPPDRRQEETNKRRRIMTRTWAMKHEELIERSKEGVRRILQNTSVKAVYDARIKRASMFVDRKKQGAAASAGLKAYWIRIKSDPIKYKELMDGKRVKLRDAMLRHHKRRAEASVLE